MTEVHTIQCVSGPTLTIPVPAEFAGQQVEIAIRVVPKNPQPWGEGLQRCAGILAADWTDEDDHILTQIHEDRKRSSHREIPE
jgi:hypothetical protein